MMPQSKSPEIARIRSEYERRRAALPAGFYGWDRPVNYFFHTQLCRTLIAGLSGEGLFPLAGRRVLDIGCGAGRWLLEFAQWGADATSLAGIDLDETRIAEARRKLPASDLHVGEAGALPWPDASFDLVSQFVVFTSVLDAAVQQEMAAEMLRVLKPGGCIVWYDFRFNNPNNPHVAGVSAARIRELFPGSDVRLRSVTLAPPLARRLVPLSWTAAALAESFPFLRTHYLALIRRPVHD